MRLGERGGSRGNGDKDIHCPATPNHYFIKLKGPCWLVSLLTNLLAPKQGGHSELVLSWVLNPEPGQGAGQSNDQGLLSGFPYLDHRVLAPSSAPGCCLSDEDRPICPSHRVVRTPPPCTVEGAPHPLL